MYVCIPVCINGACHWAHACIHPHTYICISWTHLRVRFSVCMCVTARACVIFRHKRNFTHIFHAHAMYMCDMWVCLCSDDTYTRIYAHFSSTWNVPGRCVCVCVLWHIGVCVCVCKTYAQIYAYFPCAWDIYEELCALLFICVFFCVHVRILTLTTQFLMCTPICLFVCVCVFMCVYLHLPRTHTHTCKTHTHAYAHYTLVHTHMDYIWIYIHIWTIYPCVCIYSTCMHVSIYVCISYANICISYACASSGRYIVHTYIHACIHIHMKYICILKHAYMYYIHTHGYIIL
jgi:hypothetical protein